MPRSTERDTRVTALCRRHRPQRLWESLEEGTGFAWSGFGGGGPCPQGPPAPVQGQPRGRLSVLDSGSRRPRGEGAVHSVCRAQRVMSSRPKAESPRGTRSSSHLLLRGRGLESARALLVPTRAGTACFPDTRSGQACVHTPFSVPVNDPCPPPVLTCSFMREPPQTPASGTVAEAPLPCAGASPGRWRAHPCPSQLSAVSTSRPRTAGGL